MLSPSPFPGLLPDAGSEAASMGKVISLPLRVFSILFRVMVRSSFIAVERGLLFLPPFFPFCFFPKRRALSGFVRETRALAFLSRKLSLFPHSD